MRANSSEHRDSLPSIDIALLKHAAYIFDGILFYLKCSPLPPTNLALHPASTANSNSNASTRFTLPDEFNSPDLAASDEATEDLSCDSADSDSEDEFTRYFGHDLDHEADDSMDAEDSCSQIW